MIISSKILKPGTRWIYVDPVNVYDEFDKSVNIVEILEIVSHCEYLVNSIAITGSVNQGLGIEFHLCNERHWIPDSPLTRILAGVPNDI